MNSPCDGSTTAKTGNPSVTNGEPAITRHIGQVPRRGIDDTTIETGRERDVVRSEVNNIGEARRSKTDRFGEAWTSKGSIHVRAVNLRQ
jgi:hypothetical protein